MAKRGCHEEQMALIRGTEDGTEKRMAMIE